MTTSLARNADSVSVLTDLIDEHHRPDYPFCVDSAWAGMLSYWLWRTGWVSARQSGGFIGLACWPGVAGWREAVAAGMAVVLTVIGVAVMMGLVPAGADGRSG